MGGQTAILRRPDEQLAGIGHKTQRLQHSIMKQIEYARFGKPTDVLRLTEATPGAPESGQVVVEVEAAPIHPIDLLTIRGKYGQLPELPAVPGIEGVGRVREVGQGVTQVGPGDLVLLPFNSGSWRQQVCVPAEGLFALPDRADPHQLATVSVNGLLAELLLSEIVKLRPGDWIVQNAANSSVGQYLITLAKRRGVKTANIVLALGGVDRKLRELGADAIIVDRGQDVREDVAAAVGFNAPKLGIDAVGGRATDVLASCLEPGGTVVNYGTLSGEDCRLSSDQAIYKAIRLRGFWLQRWLDEHPGEAAAHHRELAELVSDGKLVGEIEGTYPLKRFKEAVRQASRRHGAGKIILTPDSRW